MCGMFAECLVSFETAGGGSCARATSFPLLAPHPLLLRPQPLPPLLCAAPQSPLSTSGPHLVFKPRSLSMISDLAGHCNLQTLHRLANTYWFTVCGLYSPRTRHPKVSEAPFDEYIHPPSPRRARKGYYRSLEPVVATLAHNDVPQRICVSYMVYFSVVLTLHVLLPYSCTEALSQPIPYPFRCTPHYSSINQL